MSEAAAPPALSDAELIAALEATAECYQAKADKIAKTAGAMQRPGEQRVKRGLEAEVRTIHYLVRDLREAGKRLKAFNFEARRG